jgi:hypothetical protein
MHLLDHAPIDLSQLGIVGNVSRITQMRRRFGLTFAFDELNNAVPLEDPERPRLFRELLFDDAGRVVSDHWYEWDETPTAVYTFDYDRLGRLVRRVHSYLRSGDYETNHVYDEDGCIVESTLISDGRALSCMAYEYDAGRRIVGSHEMKYFEDGESHLYSRSRVAHTATGDYTVTTEMLDHDGNLLKTITSHYSAGGILLEHHEARPRPGSLVEHDERTFYDARGWIMRKESFGRLGYSWLSRYDHTLDAVGNWTSRREHIVDRTSAGASPRPVEQIDQILHR